MGKIVVTGAAGFIGSVLVGALNKSGNKDIIAVDDFSNHAKEKNLLNKNVNKKIDRNEFFDWIKKQNTDIDLFYHIGARTDTTEFDKSVFDTLNVGYSKMVWQLCSGKQIPLIYASSAATYGMGEHGYIDSHDIIKQLKPLNPYGESKNEFDIWILEQHERPPFWAGLKFFNVYGPNEYHKGRMASVIFHAFRQINETGKVRLFRSHIPEYNDGKQLRDFIYVKDVVDVMVFMKNHPVQSGIYNLGTGKARTFLDLARATFRSMGLDENIEFIDTPRDIRDKYQYFTEATMDKLRSEGYDAPFHTLEEGIKDYVKNYLIPDKHI